MKQAKHQNTVGDTIKELLTHRLAKRLNITFIQAVELLDDKLSIDNEIASALEREFHIPKLFWLEKARKSRH